MYEQEVLSLLKNETAFLASVDGNQPRVRPMKPWVDPEGHVWLFSRFDTKKVAEFKANPRVELCFVGKDQEVLTITGRLRDETRPGSPVFRATLDLMYGSTPEMKLYFPEKDTTGLVLYRLVIHEIRYMRQDCNLVTRVNLPMEQNPDIDLALCQGGFCLLEE